MVYLLGMDRIFCTKINLKINIGEKVALLGPNGAGKSTIALLSANFLFPNSGQVIFNGVAYKRSSSLHRKKIGIVLTNPYLIDKMKVEEYWRFVGGVLEVSNDILNYRILDLFELLNLSSEKGKMIGKLSQGSRTKVAIGAALLHNPEMLLFDEPFSNLDQNTSLKLAAFLKDNSASKTFLVASHNLNYLISMGIDRFVLLENGRVVKDVPYNDQSSLEMIHSFINSYEKKEFHRPDWWR